MRYYECLHHAKRKSQCPIQRINARALHASFLRGQLGKQKQMLDMRAANYIKAIGEGRMSTALIDALDKVEAEKQAVCEQLAQVQLVERRSMLLMTMGFWCSASLIRGPIQ